MNDYVYNKDRDNGNSGRVGVRHHGWVPILLEPNRGRSFVASLHISQFLSISIYQRSLKTTLNHFHLKIHTSW